MKKKNCQKRLFVFCFLLVIGVIQVFGQEKEIPLKEKKVSIVCNNVSFREVIRILIENYDVQIGFEESTLDYENVDYDFNIYLESTSKIRKSKDQLAFKNIKKTKTTFSLNLKEAKLEEILNLIVDKMPNYGWEINDEVVNFVPINGRNLKFDKLLSTKITNYLLKEGEPVDLIRWELYLQPEFRRVTSELELPYSNFRFDRISIGLKGDTNYSLSFKNLSLKKLLNEIAKVKKGGWILKKSKFKGKEYLDIQI